MPGGILCLLGVVLAFAGGANALSSASAARAARRAQRPPRH
ncbi:hypothetical protein ACWEQL_41355 [Kitasatospora sp. NPDC004240]